MSTLTSLGTNVCSIWSEIVAYITDDAGSRLTNDASENIIF